MYTINHTKTTIEILNSEKTVFAEIRINDGASLQKLILSGNTLIKDLSPLEYKNTYASSVLFPFANRIKDGAYSYEDKNYKFPINEVPNNNALHGLVFNKTFKVIDEVSTKDSASVKLLYKEDKKSDGFPFTYSIQLEYILTETSLDLNVTVINTDAKAFPFTLGWHPYFLSNNLHESSLAFESSKKMAFSERMITTGTISNPDNSEIKIKDKQLDDCWQLDKTKVVFTTPKYNLVINSTEKDSFLQAYTPPLANVIAIEPTTGVSDSFNNKIGLKTLNPKETYQLNWNLKLN
ncbi:aldose 1-epimerase [Algibacter sp. L1A34]|uniref:aldose 1-epimerase n=1 Tax=Algibacter sp. L1A34 TaxID=2686365 RepID=UPI00131A906E|nr:aldose 1-epimerase [Algibacter sp. L1A34]